MNMESVSVWTPKAGRRSLRYLDNIFIERLWRSVKYEEVYIESYQSVKEARRSLSEYFDFYNNERIHQSLGYSTPSEVYLA